MSENQKDNIIQCAARLMREVGIKTVSVDDICRELGMSKKTFYVYFETKDLLVDELLLRHEQTARAQAEKAITGMNTIELVVNFVKLIQKYKDVRQIPVLVYDLQKYYPKQFEAHLERLKTQNYEVALQCLQHGVEEGIFRKDLDIERTSYIMAVLHQHLISRVTSAKATSRTVANIKYAMDIFFRGIVSEEGMRQIQERMKEGKENM